MSRPVSTRPMADRFWSLVDKRSPAECWLWLSLRNETGYGRFAVSTCRHSKRVFAHRLAWELVYGPTELCVLHRCDNPPCCNPLHLFVGTRADNAADMVAKGRCDHPKGERNARALLTEDDVLFIREVKGALFQRELASIFGVARSTISAAQRGETWPEEGCE